MNNPIDHDDDLESRINKLERDMKQVKSTLGHIKLDTDDARESLDPIERRARHNLTSLSLESTGLS
jgi:archaellum component FlaC